MWRTDTFSCLFDDVSAIVGAKTGQAFAKLGVGTVWDLLRHLPRSYVYGTQTSSLTQLQLSQVCAIIARVKDIRTSLRGHRSRLVAELTDGDGVIDAVFFGKEYLVKYWSKALSQGERGIFVGKVTQFRDRLQMTHPNFVMMDESGTVVGWANESKHNMVKTVTRSGMVGLYPSSASLATWEIAECVHLALDHISTLTDPLPEQIRRDWDLPGFYEACRLVHQPQSKEDIERGQNRLRCDEATWLQVAMGVRRRTAQSRKAAVMTARPSGLEESLYANLPFALTAGQEDALDVIGGDLARATPMQRLLQGDVGSGKTVVALAAMCRVVDNGYQAVLLAPTEVLATQHYATITRLMDQRRRAALPATAQPGSSAPGHTSVVADALAGAETSGEGLDRDGSAEVTLLIGSLSAAEKNRAVERIASGEAGIIIGTHAVLSDSVLFHNLGLVVVDEQHRFGVEQRARLTENRQPRPHELVMTATPIPRSVAMTCYGDLDLTKMTQMPSNRAGVETHVVNLSATPHWIRRVWERVGEEVAKGRQVFVVCPTISESCPDPEADLGGDDSLDREDSGIGARPDQLAFDDVDPKVGSPSRPLASVEAVADYLAKQRFPQLRVASLHSQMDTAAKAEVMGKVVGGEIDIVVATTVIEVGIDVPNASMMVILDADRFGISQLHQLRGRIGRGPHPGVCLLVAELEPGSIAKARLDVIESTRDGFALAEMDLALRSEGDILGANQSGRSSLKLLSVARDAHVIDQSRKIADSLLAAEGALCDPMIKDMVSAVERIGSQDWLLRN